MMMAMMAAVTEPYCYAGIGKPLVCKAASKWKSLCNDQEGMFAVIHRHDSESRIQNHQNQKYLRAGHSSYRL